MCGFHTLRYHLQAPSRLTFLDLTDRFADAECEYILNYTSNVIKISENGVQYFFKEARVREKRLDTYIFKSVDTFFDEIATSPSLKRRVLDSLGKRKNLRRLVNMGYKNARGDRLHRYLVCGNEAILGLPKPMTESDRREIRLFVFYMYGEIQNWFYNVDVKAGQLQTFSAVRALATQELARLLGLSELIVRCDFVKLCLNGRIKYGVLSERASGDTLTSLPYSERARLVTPHLLRSLTNLNLIDVISGDNDHRVGNYHVDMSAPSDASCVRSYDNDSPDSFGCLASIRGRNIIGCSSFLDRAGRVNRAHLDKAPTLALLSIKKEQLLRFSPYLSSVSRRFLWLRICRARRAILKTLHLREDFLLDRDEWKEDHIKLDLSSKYGKTYLKSLLSECYYETGKHEFDTL